MGTVKAGGVATRHPEYDDNITRWLQVDDVVEARVKDRGTRYLPKPNSSVNKCSPDKAAYYSGTHFDESAYNRACSMWRRETMINDERYLQYKERAMFYNFTKRTKDGMIGAIFRKDPELVTPTGLSYLQTNVDGNNTNLDQQARVTLDQVLRKGRAFLLVDMPQLDGPSSLADIQSGKAVPRIYKYNAQNVINWKTRNIGSTVVLDMVVLEEHREAKARDIFSHECEKQYRVLLINEEGYYEQRIYDGNDEIIDVIDVKVNGQRLNYLPGYFIGSEENDFSVDTSPLYDLTEINIAHYRNSADNEESSFICGQPTLVLSPSASLGSPQQFAEANPNGIMIGSRSGINMGDGGSANMLQADPNNLAKQNMLDKEEQAKQLGAELITPTTQQTAEAARIDKAADTSVLAVVAKNVSDAYVDAINMCGRFLGLVPIDASSDEIEYELNTTFFMEMMTAQDRAQWVAEIQSGITPRAYYYSKLRKSGEFPADVSDEDIAVALEAAGMDGVQGLI